MRSNTILPFLAMSCALFSACALSNYLKGGLHGRLDTSLTIVALTQDPEKYLNKEIVFSVKYFKKAEQPCSLGEDYVNFVIMDRVSGIRLEKVWINKSRAGVLDRFKPDDTVVMKARVFTIDSERDPNIEALEIVPE